MFDIEFIVPYKDLLDSVLEAFEEFPLKDEINLHVKIMDREEAKGHTFFGQAIISRGLTAQYLKSLNLNRPLIELPISGYDVIRAVSLGLNMYKASHIAFVGTPDMIYGAQALELFFHRKITVHPLDIADDVDELLKRCHEAGADLFIGGSSLFKRAKNAGYNVVRIESGKEAIRQAFNESLRSVTIWYQERERAERFRVLVDHVHEGILSTDQKGFITVINNDAVRLLKLSNRPLVGQFIGNVVPEIQFSEFQSLNTPSFGELVKVKGSSLTMNWIPITVNKHVAGILITFQMVTHIQEIESRIRRKVYRKGLVTHYNFPDIIGDSETIRNTISLAQDYSKVNANIIIVGETGTGKELFSQSIHANSNRSNGPFVAINCAALPESLLESELFGYVEGAFTGAAKGGKIGLFELAHQGTIFLDEISEISLFLQGRLLRVLEEREIMRLGHDEVVPVDIRIIAATNKNLHALVEKGQFREDLFYRLDVLRLNIPPVRQRGRDIIMLINYFLEGFRKEGQGCSCVLEMHPECWNFLMNQKWNGNVRQIRNFCERLSVISKNESVSLSDAVCSYEIDSFKTEVLASCKDDVEKNPWEEVLNVERATIINALKQSENREEAAQLLGIDRTTLWRRMKKLKITR